LRYLSSIASRSYFSFFITSLSLAILLIDVFPWYTCNVWALLKREKTMRANWNLVVEKILTHANEDDLSVLFHLLLTEEERSAVSGRLQVFQTLLAGELSQRQIAAEHQVSIATITRCSNYLKNMPVNQRDLVKKLILD
jgi:TrpR family trp operon transcriptional repressor